MPEQLGLFDEEPDAREPGRAPAPDQAARDRIHSDLGSTLFVEAGAGSGKTTALVDRVLALVTSGEVELDNIAAITFTEKAGAELRDRLRQALEEAAAKPSATAEIADRCAAARDALDGAAIGTLHAFAQRILAEHPIEAGLPPRVEVLDEVSSEVEFDLRWRRFQDELLAEPALERTLLLFFAAGVKVTALRVLAESFDNSWDLVADRVPETAPDPPQVLPRIDEALRGIDEAVAMSGQCKVAGDTLLDRLGEMEAFARRLRAMDDELDVLEALDEDAPEKPPSFKVGRVGRAPNWDGIESVRSALTAAAERLDAALDEVKQACVHRIAVELRRFTLAAAEERRAAGRLQFHDLLVMARALLTSPEHGAAVRASLARRYQRLLLDEFQDTDPIQIELAVRIAAADPRSAEAGTLPWDQVPIAPGRLFVVGDPKQSIYRFRRADIAVFLAAQARYGPPVELTANFRTGDTILEWINTTFAALMDLPDDVELSLPSQVGSPGTELEFAL